MYAWHDRAGLIIFHSMCGRVVQSSDPLRYAIVDGLDMPDTREKPPSYNVTPSQRLYVIRENYETGARSLDLLQWGLIPHHCEDAEGGHKPINARAESVARLPSFRSAYAKRRCIVPADCFFEWCSVKGARAKQPYAVAMKDRTPFAIGGLWENWKDPRSGKWVRTVTIVTVPSNELVSQIHDRMPLILPASAYERWLGTEPNPHDLLVPFPSEQMAIWPVSTRVNKLENDEPSLLDPAA